MNPLVPPRGAVYLLLMLAGTLLAFFRPQAPAKVCQRTLTFAERVAYQRAIEDVYWRHRIWPKERPDPKPSLDALMSQATIHTARSSVQRVARSVKHKLQIKSPSRLSPQCATVSASIKPGRRSSHCSVARGIWFLSQRPGLVPPRPLGRALARTGASSRSIEAALMACSFSLSGSQSAPYSFS